MAKAKPAQTEVVEIKKANLQTIAFQIEGTAPYVQHRFGEKALKELMAKQSAGSTAKAKKIREKRDFDAEYKSAMHLSTDEWNGIPANGLRAALVSACRVANYVMTRAKLAVFVEADGHSRDGVPLFKITKGNPSKHSCYVRIQQTVMPVVRPMWAPGWTATARITFDADMLTASDIANLLERAGRQVGIGEGRPDSRSSTGMGWGTFAISGIAK